MHARHVVRVLDNPDCSVDVPIPIKGIPAAARDDSEPFGVITLTIPEFQTGLQQHGIVAVHSQPERI